MSVWNNTPNANQIVSTTQQPINQNFVNTNVWFAVNHVPAGTSGFGKHTIMTSVQQGSDPTIAGTDIALYNKADTNSIAQFFINRLAGGSQQLTGVIPSGTSTGYTWNFADGMQVRMGTITCTLTSGLIVNTPVTFETSFPNNCFGVVVNQYYISATAFFSARSPTKDGCNITSLSTDISGSVSVFYIAFGN